MLSVERAGRPGGRARRVVAVAISVVFAVAAFGAVGAPNAASAGEEDEVFTSTANPAETITIVVGGDLGLGGSGQPVDPRGAYRHGRLIPFADMTRKLAPLLDGDLNFANLETVVTDDNRLPAFEKTFNFRSHSVGVRHLVDIGFNVFSTANNHVIDYGTAGMVDTLRHLQQLERHGLKAAAGLGANRAEALTPKRIEVKSSVTTLSAVGIGGRSPTENSPGMPSYRDPRDFGDTLTELARTASDYRIFSAHYGPELSIAPAPGDVFRLRDQAVRGIKADLVLGHHAHVAAGVQVVDGRLIFYGLGNLLHPGMQNMARFNACRDYGLLGKVHVGRGSDGRLRAIAVEVTALTDMHEAARPLTGVEGRRRIAVLNGLAAGLDHDENARGLRFVAREDGSGYACLPAAATATGPVGAMCKDWERRKADIEPANTTCGPVQRLSAPRPSAEPASARPRSPARASQQRDWRDEVFNR